MSKRDDIQAKIDELLRKQQAQIAGATQAASVIQRDYLRMKQILEIRNPETLESVWAEYRPRLENTLKIINTSVLSQEEPTGVTQSWNEPFWMNMDSFQPPLSGLPPGAVRVGELRVPLGRSEGRTPALIPIRAIKTRNGQWHVPGHIILETQKENARKTALGLLQSIAIRTLCTFPIRTMRGIFVDSVGMGNNFPLKGFPELMVGPKVYTRSDEIREQLRVLTVHIEQIIQKYLSANFKTIEDFNAEKALVREPYRYLFIADFPSGFDLQALEDLTSILKNGARAGVYVILHLDRTLERPHTLKDYAVFEHYAARLSVTIDADNRSSVFFSLPTGIQFSAIPDSPPTPEQVACVIGTISTAFKNTRSESIPWTELVPKDQDALWAEKSIDEIRAPIGVSGARDYIELWLGHEEEGKIATNTLLAGKPGAGKSYTLHAMINSLALRYAPNELEMYLLDFKSGVEFQVYVDPNRYNEQQPQEEFDTTRSLPHAKVIAIDSEREFGLSVLRRLHQELIARGTLLRQAGVDGIKGYRQKYPDAMMPRILAVFDEFQHIFQKSDALSGEANMLIETLTRMGRAFGIHLIFATQSPIIDNFDRGIYSFIDLRMAQQMDEKSAAFVLAEDNVDSITLLEKPGDILYNPMMGRRGYNEFGRIANISPQDRRDNVQKIFELANTRGFVRPEPLVVFDGRQAARLKRNPQLNALIRMSDWLSLSQLNKQVIQDPDWLIEHRPGVAWLGESASIGNHVFAVFRQRQRSNMLVVGHSETVIYGILGGALLSLVHCYPPGQALFFLIDLSRNDEDTPWTTMMPAFREAFGTMFSISLGKQTPDAERNISRYQTVLDKALEEFNRRKSLRETNPDEVNFGPSIFLVCAIGPLNRADRLRPEQGTRSEVPSETAKSLIDLVAKGPELGIHTLLWLEDMRTFSRVNADDKSWITHFDLRVALRLTQDESRTLLRDTNAEMLGQHRALLLDDASSLGLQKFKPYAVPSDEEIADYGNQLAQRNRS